MAIFNGNKEFSKKGSYPAFGSGTQNVRQAFNIQKAYANGVFQLEPKGRRLCMTDVMYLRISITSTRTEQRKRTFCRN
mgnify:CR=1 FL=1